MRMSVRSVFGISILRGVLVCLTAAASATVATASTSSVAQSAEVAGNHGNAAARAYRHTERERIHTERAVSIAKRQHEEMVCSQRFSVEDCLIGVRAQARKEDVRLRLQEIELNDAERKEKAAERLRLIQEKKEGAQAVPAHGRMPGASVRKTPTGESAHNNPLQRDLDAERRAQDHRNRLEAQNSEQTRRGADRADRAAKAQTRQREVQKAAEARRARVEKLQSEATAAGRQSAAPLPPSTYAP